VKPIALLALLVTLAVAQHWDIEKVDSAGWGKSVRMRMHPDGRLLLCYQDTSGRIRLAHRDSAWSYDSLTGLSGHYGLSFSISAQGALGVSWLDPDYPWYVFMASNKGDSWDYDSTGLAVTGPGPAFVAHDTAGVASIVYTCTDGGGGCSVVRARPADSSWTTDTILTGGGWSATFSCYGYAISPRDSASLLCVFADAFPGPGLTRPWYYQDLFVARESGDSWVETEKAYAWYDVLGAEAMALDTLGVPQACWRDTLPMFRYEGIALDTQAYNSSIAIDRLNRPCIAYTRPELVFTTRLGNQWHSTTVSADPDHAISISIVIGDDGEPLLAFSNADGLWLAHGVDIMGQSEEQQQPKAIGRQIPASVVRNAFFLPGAASLKSRAASLLDVSGRKVLDLKAGANDVGGLAPGVYFLREEHAQAQAQAVRKVVITR
jgi:hypothetical protein